MKKFILSVLILLICFAVGFAVWKFIEKNGEKYKEITMTATVTYIGEDFFIVKDQNHKQYYFDMKDSYDIQVGDQLNIKYNTHYQTEKQKKIYTVLNYKKMMPEEEKKEENESIVPMLWQDNGIFQSYYEEAYQTMQQMTLDEKIAQLLLVRYPSENAVSILEQYQFGGYVLFGRDFKDKTQDQVKEMISQLQSVSKIPILTAVDEEGGTVVRISSNPNLASHKFQSPQELYQAGGFAMIEKDTLEKSQLLMNYGINLNLAPVVDVSTNPEDYMYERTLGEDASLTSRYAETVISASKETSVSYTLKHFPGYGNNVDTHTGMAIDKRSYDEIEKDALQPFEAGIRSGAEAVLISHNVIVNMDESNPASLSINVHNLLRDQLQFTGIVMTDDLAMKAVSDIPNVVIKALLAGNDLIITTDYETSIQSIKSALEQDLIDESIIDHAVFRVIAWKYYKGLL